MLKTYLKRIFEVASRGDDREESYYSTLEKLLEEYAVSAHKSHITLTTLPKKTEAGNPDFRVWDGKQHIVGYIEAKTPATKDLDEIEETEQLKRYLHTFPNVILTNFFEFRLYRSGTLIDSVQIARPFILHKLKTTPPAENQPQFFELLEKFLSFSFPKVYEAKTLAIELAKRTRFLRDEVVARELEEEAAEGMGHISGFYEAFRKFLISGLSQEDFADLYSQTITYGLFASRTRSENGFNRKLAYDNIPQTIGILRDVFQFISLGKLPAQMEWIIDDISEVLAVTDVKKILHDYFHEGKGRDPIVHFYETFLVEYDPKTREKRGVYYTPEPAVSYIVRSLHLILKEHFKRSDGLAGEAVTVLDPAAGTLTFMAEAAKLAVAEFVSKYGEGAKANFIKEHVLKNFYAFELMMAPYAVGHLKMSFLLEELGYKLQPDDRFKLYLTNTLEMEELEQSELPGMVSLSEESHLAGKVKKETPILVILGNPPYSGHSANKGQWIDDLLKKGYTLKDGSKDEGYYAVDGRPLGEKNPKWLQDDYVKFIRFAQWKIDRAGEGILGFISNHSYLDNPTFRGMRQSLMKTFDEIYVLDLHGNTLKKEKCPDGSKDENVFDIRQGVAIALFIKNKGGRKPCTVFHSEIWGLREGKYGWLESNDASTTHWKRLAPKTEYYLYIAREEKLWGKYGRFSKISNIFMIKNTGIITSRDKFVIDFDSVPLLLRIRLISNLKTPEDLVKQTYSLRDVREKTLAESRKEIAEIPQLERYCIDILYRPFDKRKIFYHSSLVRWPVYEVMRHMMGENLALIAPKQFKEQPGAFITTDIIGHKTVSAYDINYIFPLYIYQDAKKKDLFSGSRASSARISNIDQDTGDALAKAYKKEPFPEEILYYIYGILYSNTYRSKYAQFLKLDFPRVPFTKDYALFSKIAELGATLVDLHLMKSKELEQPVTRFLGPGENRVDRVRYEKDRVYINLDQYFEGVEPEVWGYQIGGYQVCDKWLKDRKGRKLSLEEIKHYCKIATALEKTITVQKEIDKLYPNVEENVIDFPESIR